MVNHTLRVISHHIFLRPNNMNIETIDIPKCIRANQYYQITSTIKNYEDTLAKLFANSKQSHLTSTPDIHLWPLTTNDNDLFSSITIPTLNLSLNEIPNIVITGPYIRSCLVTSPNIPTIPNTIRNEIYIYKYTPTKWKNLLDTSTFTEKPNEYVTTHESQKICLIKKTFKSPAHILLQHNYLKRVGFHNNTFIVSSMFLLEFQKHNHLINTSFHDPILNHPYDPLEIYNTPKKDTSLINLIKLANHEQLLKLPKKNFNDLHSSKTAIEHTIDRFIIEDNPIILNNLRLIIIYLSDATYIRPPHLYAQLPQSNLYQKDPQLYNLLTSISSTYQIPDPPLFPTTLTDINNYILEQLIISSSSSSPSALLDFMTYLTITPSPHLLNLIIKHNALSITPLALNLNQEDTHYLTLMTQNLDLTTTFDFDHTLAQTWLPQIIDNSLLRSFYFLYDHNPSIIDTTIDGQSLLHLISQNIPNTKDMIKLLLKLKPSLLDQPNNTKETPPLFHSQHNPTIIQHLLSYDFDGTTFDANGNTFLHNLCHHNVPIILRQALKKYHELIDLPNKNFETPAIIASKYHQEDMFYSLKGMGADLLAKDRFGNTVYHYICSNSMCLGMTILDIPNYFGFLPSDYCKLASTYYTFVEP